MYKGLVILLFLSCSTQTDSTLTNEGFKELIHTVSEGWNTNNAKRAADCFTDGAVYIEPPDRQLYISKDSLFHFFGGTQGRKNPMNMTWHHAVFEEENQVGFAEYTFKYKGRSTHGIVIIKIVDGKIDKWREYQYRSYVDWKTFIGKSAFN